MDAERFADAWDEFFAAVRRARGRAAQAQKPGALTLAQYQLIAVFEREDELSVSEVALAGGVAVPTATRMLSALERDGIVERRSSEVDRRSVRVTLTKLGRQVLKAKREVIAAKQQAIYQSLNPDERGQAVSILNRLAVAMEEL